MFATSLLPTQMGLIDFLIIHSLILDKSATKANNNPSSLASLQTNQLFAFPFERVVFIDR